jgi:hypothetical protein
MDKPTLQLIDLLEATLTQSIQWQDQLAQLLERKRDALRRGTASDVGNLGRLETGVVQAIGQLEQRRSEIVKRLSTTLAPEAGETLKMRDLAERLPEPHRGRLLVTRVRLVEAMQRVAERTSVVRRASEALVQHVNGLIRTIGVVSHGGAAYGQTGRVSNAPVRMSSLNLTA